MNTKYNSLILATSLLLSACGGGGGDSSSGGDTAPAPTPPVAIAPTPDDDLGAQSLTIDAEFTLTSEVELVLDIRPENVGTGAFLTICQYDPNNEVINRQECVYKGPIDNDGVEDTITLAHRDTALAAEVWLFIENYQPENYLWAYDLTAQQQRFQVR